MLIKNYKLNHKGLYRLKRIRNKQIFRFKIITPIFWSISTHLNIGSAFMFCRLKYINVRRHLWKCYIHIIQISGFTSLIWLLSPYYTIIKSLTLFSTLLGFCCLEEFLWSSKFHYLNFNDVLS